MPTAPGTVSRDSDSNKISAVFILSDGNIATYNAILSTSVPSFNSTNSTLTYSSEADLAGAQVFVGLLGVTTITLTVGTGVTITGQLTQPVSPAQTINGSGRWLLAPPGGDNAEASECFCLAEY